MLKYRMDQEAATPSCLLRSALMKLIYSLDDEVLIDACWAISYLSDCSNDKIQAVIESGVCRRLVELLMHPSTSVQTPRLSSFLVNAFPRAIDLPAMASRQRWAKSALSSPKLFPYPY